MCDVGGNGCDVFEFKTHTARKWHWCTCSALIAPGEKYTSYFTIYEGEVTTTKQCMLCCEAMTDFEKAHDGYSFADADRALRDCIQGSDDDDDGRWSWWLWLISLNSRRTRWAFAQQLAESWGILTAPRAVV